MVTNIQYTNIKRVLDDLLDHPLLRDLTLEQVIRHTIRFISLHGYPALYYDKIDNVEIKDFRGLLPCDLVSITQVKDTRSGKCLRAMSDTFIPSLNPRSKERHYDRDCEKRDPMNNARPIEEQYILPMPRHFEELSFKTQGRVIFTSFPHGEVEVSYKAIPIDEDGYPLLIDNEVYLNALEAYIKVKVFTVKYDLGKIAAGVLSNAQTDYAWAAHECKQEFTIPSMSEMESITRALNTMIKPVTHFDNGFKNLGDREYRRRY